MSPARKVYILGVWLAKILIIFLSLMGIFSILKQIGFISPRQGDRQVVKEVVEGSMVAVESWQERERLYERRREVAREVCEDQEERITLSTVKMYDLVPPAPIGRQAGNNVEIIMISTTMDSVSQTGLLFPSVKLRSER